MYKMQSSVPVRNFKITFRALCFDTRCSLKLKSYALTAPVPLLSSHIGIVEWDKAHKNRAEKGAHRLLCPNLAGQFSGCSLKQRFTDSFVLKPPKLWQFYPYCNHFCVESDEQLQRHRGNTGSVPLQITCTCFSWDMKTRRRIWMLALSFV